MTGTASADSYEVQPTPLNYANDMQSPAVVFPVGGPAMTVARQIADRTWGYDPCGGSVSITWATAAPTVNATATWSNPTDAYADPQQNTDCSVAFNDQQSYDWPMLCTVFVHEFGHLTGHQHSTDQNDVMFPYYTTPMAACSSTPNPQNPVAAPAAPRSAHITHATTARHSKKKKKHHKRKRRHARTRSHHGSNTSHSLAHSRTAPKRNRHSSHPRARPRRRDAEPDADCAALHTYHA